jgi:hypothetical protein
VQTVVCKATFDLLPGVAKLSQAQDHPNENDDYWNDDPVRSLHAPSDLTPFKPRADVLLVGHAFAPRREAVRSLLVRLVVGLIDKSIEVFGDRFWTSDGTVSESAQARVRPRTHDRSSCVRGHSHIHREKICWTASRGCVSHGPVEQRRSTAVRSLSC